jgi:hypothetical protein
MPGRLVFSTTADGAASPTERMRITSAGFVGIGTSNPSAVLNVVGHNEFTLGLTAQSSSTQTAFLSHPVAILANTSSAAGNGAGLRYNIADTGGVARTAGGIGTVATAKDASSVTADMYFYTGTTPTERMRITSAGRVGIGTSSPAVSLVVSSTDSIRVPVGTTGERPTGATGYLRFNTTTTSFEGFNGTAWGSIGGGAAGGGTDAIFYNNGQTVTTDYSIPSGQNAGTFGPITVNSGVTVTVPSGSTWSIV